MAVPTALGVGAGSRCIPWTSVLAEPLSFFLSEPWTMGISKSYKKKFFYNKKTKTSTFDLPIDSIAPFQ